MSLDMTSIIVEEVGDYDGTPEWDARYKAKVAARLAGTTGHVEAAPARGTADEWKSLFRSGGSAILDVPATPSIVWGNEDGVAWAQGESLMICGPSGVGKSTLAIQLAMARLGLIGPGVLGMPVRPSPPDKRVLYLAMDRPPQLMRAMHRLVSEANREHLDNYLQFWFGPPPRDLAKRPETLLEMCQHVHADTVIVDSLKDGFLGVADDQAGSGYNTARQKVLVNGIEVVEIHHTRKANGDNKKPDKLSDVYGSMQLAAGAGSVFMLWGDAGDPIVEFTHLKQPAEPVGPWKITHDMKTGLSSIEHDVDILKMVLTAGPAGVTNVHVAMRMFTTPKPTAAENMKAERKLAKLVTAGQISKRPGAPGGVGGSGAATYHGLAP